MYVAHAQLVADLQEKKIEITNSFSSFHHSQPNGTSQTEFMAIKFVLFRINLMTNYINLSAASKRLSFPLPFTPLNRTKIFIKIANCELHRKRKINLMFKVDVRNINPTWFRNRSKGNRLRNILPLPKDFFKNELGIKKWFIIYRVSQFDTHHTKTTYGAC